MGTTGVGSGGQSMNVSYTSKTAPGEVINAAKKRLEAAEGNDFEGAKKIQPNNFEDGSEMSEQSASISKNLKNASEEVKEMLKQPNAFTDCFPSIPKGPKNQIEQGMPGPKGPKNQIEQGMPGPKGPKNQIEQGMPGPKGPKNQIEQGMPVGPKGPKNQIEQGISMGIPMGFPMGIPMEMKQEPGSD